MMKVHLFRCFSLLAMAGWLLGGDSARAIILFNLDNSANQSDPGSGVPWDAVGKVTNTAGTSVSGSVVYLGNGYVLTANHVTVGGVLTHVTFDGATTFPIDLTYFSGSASQQVAAGVDMKILKLATTPSITGANILTTASENTSAATVIGWGVGRDSTPLGGASVGWGSNTSSAKRWGLNGPEGSAPIAYDSYSYESIITVAGGNDGAGSAYNPDGLGDAEAALTINDSGSGLFQNIAGTWYLIGIGTNVDTGGMSIFGHDDVGGAGYGDNNYFVRISSYDAGILSAIPEPGTYLLLGLGLMVVWGIRARCRGDQKD